MKFDLTFQKKVEEIVRWCSAERGRANRLRERVNTMLIEPINMATFKNWIRPDRKNRAEPRLSTGMALVEAYRIERGNGIPKKAKRAVAGSAKRDGA